MNAADISALLGRLGLAGLPIVNVENACSSSSSAMAQGVMAVSSSAYDVVLVIGVEKLTKFGGGTLPLDEDDWEVRLGLTMPALYAMRAQRYMHDFGVSLKDVAGVSVKNRKLSDADVAELRAAMTLPSSVEDLSTMGFALARALEDRGNYAASLAELETANARVRAHRRWDAASYTAHIDSILKAFSPPPAGAIDAQLGRDVIFIVSLPRSGSTLTEQVLDAHSLVDGGGELPDLPAVLTEEARWTGQAFPDFIAGLTPNDWARMGS